MRLEWDTNWGDMKIIMIIIDIHRLSMCLALLPWSRSPDCSSTACTGHTSKSHITKHPMNPKMGISHVFFGRFLGDRWALSQDGDFTHQTGPWLFAGIAIFAVASAIASRTCHGHHGHHGTVQSQGSQRSQPGRSWPSLQLAMPGPVQLHLGTTSGDSTEAGRTWNSYLEHPGTISISSISSMCPIKSTWTNGAAQRGWTMTHLWQWCTER